MYNITIKTSMLKRLKEFDCESEVSENSVLSIPADNFSSSLLEQLATFFKVSIPSGSPVTVTYPS